MKLFKDLPNTDTPINAENLNQIQDNLVVVSPTEPTGDNREKVWIQKGKNLFNKSRMVGNLTINEDGIFENDETASVHYIQVVSGKTYSISSNLDRQWVLNTSVNIPSLGGSGNVRTVTSGTTIQVTIPEGHNYLNIRNHPSSANEDSINQNVQVEQNSTATAYEAYIEPKIYVLNDNDVYEEFISKEDTLERYSTEEQIIGTWIDGKTLYRKVINVGTTTTVTTKIDYIPDIKAIIKQYVSYSWGGMLFSIGSNAIYSGSGNIAMEFDRAPESTNIVAVIEYTKTTD